MYIFLPTGILIRSENIHKNIYCYNGDKLLAILTLLLDLILTVPNVLLSRCCDGWLCEEERKNSICLKEIFFK